MMQRLQKHDQLLLYQLLSLLFHVHSNYEDMFVCISNYLKYKYIFINSINFVATVLSFNNYSYSSSMCTVVEYIMSFIVLCWNAYFLIQPCFREYQDFKFFAHYNFFNCSPVLIIASYINMRNSYAIFT